MGINWNVLTSILKNINLSPNLANKSTYDIVVDYSTNPSEFQRLSWLGDAVLKSAFSEWLYKNLTNERGPLTSARSLLEADTALVSWAKKKKLYYILFDEDIPTEDLEEFLKDFEDTRELADIVEALIGAMAVDLGLDIVSLHLSKLFIDELNTIKEKCKDTRLKDDKSFILELEQAKLIELKRENPTPIGKRWRVQWTVTIHGESLSRKAIGKSKLDAEQKVARQILDELSKLDPIILSKV